MSNARQEYYQANKGRENASAKAYHAKNRDSRLVLIRKYRRANPEVFVVKHSEYRARTRGHAPIAMTAARLRTWLLRQGDRCKLCDRPGRNPLRVGVGKVG